MSNRIDFNRSTQRRAAIPAATISILLDGKLCPNLQLKEIVRGGRGEFSWAGLAVNSAAYKQGDLIAAENSETEFAMGQSVCVRRLFNGVPPGAAAFSEPVFCGQIEGIETNLTPDGEVVEITARDFSANLERITVYGRRLAQADGTSIFLAGLDTAFNPDGKANAEPAPIEFLRRAFARQGLELCRGN